LEKNIFITKLFEKSNKSLTAFISISKLQAKVRRHVKILYPRGKVELV